MYDIIIVGAGIAGMTAAIYAKRAGKEVLLLDEASYGGQIINSNSVENYPGFSSISGYELATSIFNQTQNFGVSFKMERVVNITESREVITNKNKYQARAIIIASGLRHKRLDVIGEDKFLGKGLSYCATCDGNFYKNLDVCVVGGGNTALEDALYLSNICNHVYLIHRRDELRGDKYLIDLLNKKDNVSFIFDSVVKEIRGDDKMSSVLLLNKTNNKEVSINVSGVFVAVGYEPSSKVFNNVINLDEGGYIKSDDCTTNVSGIFVAGDVRSKKLRQLVTASSDGAIAATLAVSYLK